MGSDRIASDVTPAANTRYHSAMLAVTGLSAPRFLTLVVVLLFFCCACGEGFETDPTPGPSDSSWSKGFGDDQNQTIHGVAVDRAGNIYVTGAFAGFTDFGGGPIEAAGMSQDVFVVKYDTDGNHLWSKRFGDGSDQTGRAVAVSRSGDVVIVGNFGGSMDIAGQFLQASDGADAFVAVLDAGGNERWAASFEGAGVDIPRGLAVDAAGNIVVAGDFEGDINLQGEPFTSAGATDVFVVKLLPSGELVWARRFGSVEDDEVDDVATNSDGDIALTGVLRGASSIDFGGGPLDPVGVDPNDDAYAVVLAPDGAHRWSKRLGDAQFQRGAGVAYDSNDDLLLVGHFSGTIDFGGESRTSSGSFDAYVAKLDRDGAPIWSRAFGVTSNVFSVGVACDPARNVSVTGDFDGVVEFGGSQLDSAGLNDVFFAQLDPAASHAISSGFGNDLEQHARGIAVDSAGNAILIGNFYGSIDFGFGEHTSTGDMDQNPYIAKLAP